MENAPTKTSAELMRQLIDALASAAAAADDASIQNKEGFYVSMRHVEVKITLALDLIRGLRAAGYAW